MMMFVKNFKNLNYVVDTISIDWNKDNAPLSYLD